MGAVNMVVDPYSVALATDLYQLTMGASYHALDMRAPATFSLFARSLPATRNFLVVAGLADALARLQTLRFDAEAITYLRSVGQIRSDFVDALADLRFTGEVWAVREGEIVFAGEPLLEVQAPIIEAQLAETMLLNALHFPTLVASKAARCVAAAPHATFLEFGLRRTPSIDAGLAVARAAYLAGFHATSNVLAGARYGIPVAGTVAHSFIETFASELEAFRAFARTFPGPVTLLIDTYDTLQGARHAAQVTRELATEGKRVLAVRIDSGDLATLSHQVRGILDKAGFPGIQIVGSGGLDEWSIAELTAAGAPFDAYGVGTSLGTSEDAPSADLVYKLVEYDGQPCLKLSAGKQTLVGPKQVWRHHAHGVWDGDRIAARDEPPPGLDWESLLAPAMQQGEPVSQSTLAELRTRHTAAMTALPSRLRVLDGSPEGYPVEVSPILASRQAAVVAAVRSRESNPV